MRVVLWSVAVVIAAAFTAAIAAAEERPKVEIVPQLGHSDSVDTVAFAPDGKTVLSGSWDGTLRLWDLASGREIRKFEGLSGGVESVAIAPDGKTALACSMQLTLTLWDLASGREIKKFEDPCHSIAFSPDGKAALSGGGYLRLWDLASGREIRKFEGHSETVLSVAIASDGKTALSGSADKTVRLWDLASGREIKKFEGHSRYVKSVAFSPDGKTALSAGEADVLLSNGLDDGLRFWDLASGQEIKKFQGYSSDVYSVAIAPDGKTALSSKGDTLRLWDLASGREIKRFEGHSILVFSVAIAPDGKTALSGGADNTVRLWDLASGRQIKKFDGHSDPLYSIAITPDGKTVLSGGVGKTLRLWDLANGREIKKFEGLSGEVNSVAIAPDSKTALSGGEREGLTLWDLTSGREVKKFEDVSRSIAFSPDGKTALSVNRDTLRLWDLDSGREIRNFSSAPEVKLQDILKFNTEQLADSMKYLVNSVAFSPDGKIALSGNFDSSLTLWDLASGRQLNKFWGHPSLVGVKSVAVSPNGKTALSGGEDKTLKLWELPSGREIKQLGLPVDYRIPRLKIFSEFEFPDGHSGSVESVAFSPDGKTALSGSADKTVRLWDLVSGDQLKKFEGHTGEVKSVTIAPDGKTALSGGLDGTIRLWDLQRGKALVSLSASRGGDQLAITPDGFFTSSQRDTDMLAIVRGFEVTTIGQVHQSLYNPDLIREALAGDPNHEVEAAAKVINLDKVLEAGPPPAIAITSHEPGSHSANDLVTVAARITDRGKGIGRIEWRLNGVSAGVMGAQAGPGPDYDVTQELALDPGVNTIEVIAYEGRNLLASRPAQTSISYEGPADTTKPKLFVLAIGINKYVDRGGGDGLFPPLAGSVPDARAFSAEIEKAGVDLYEKVHVTLALDEDATLSKLDEVVTRIASEISPRDTFVLYAAAHGYSLGGNYYMIPQDYQGGTNPAALKSRTIGQQHIQEWLAKRIKAKRAMILLDTCESGALTNGYVKSRTQGPVSEAAVGRLHEATGRPVLTAAAAGQLAFENYKGHGVFTYALMEALHKGDTNNNGKIEVTELAAHVQGRVPELFAELKSNGWVVKGVTIAAARGGSGDAQSAHFGSTGEDFAIVARLP